MEFPFSEFQNHVTSSSILPSSSSQPHFFEDDDDCFNEQSSTPQPPLNLTIEPVPATDTATLQPPETAPEPTAETSQDTATETSPSSSSIVSVNIAPIVSTDLPEHKTTAATETSPEISVLGRDQRSKKPSPKLAYYMTILLHTPYPSAIPYIKCWFF